MLAGEKVLELSTAHDNLSKRIRPAVAFLQRILPDVLVSLKEIVESLACTEMSSSATIVERHHARHERSA